MDPSTSLPDYLPHQLSEDSFRKYEPFIREGVSRFPEETEFPKFDGIAPTTFLARFRDAIVSLKKFSWQTDIDVRKLWEVSGQYCLSLDPSGRSVWFRVKHRAGRPTHMIEEARRLAPNVDASLQTRWSTCTEAEFESLCLLIHTGKIKGPIVVQQRFAKENNEHYEATLNVAIVDDEVAGCTIVN